MAPRGGSSDSYVNPENVALRDRMIAEGKVQPLGTRSNAERAAALRAENPQIDADAARTRAGGRFVVGGEGQPATRPNTTPIPDMVAAPPQRAWSSETAPEQIGVGIPREPTKLVLTPDEAGQEAQTLRAFKPSARVQGMKAAARVPRGEQEATLKAQGFSDYQIGVIMHTVFGGDE